MAGNRPPTSEGDVYVTHGGEVYVVHEGEWVPYLFALQRAWNQGYIHADNGGSEEDNPYRT